MIRFGDLLLILTQRAVPAESLTISEKVVELATRQYIEQYRAALTIQKHFRGSLVATRKKYSKHDPMAKKGGPPVMDNPRLKNSHFFYREVADLV